VTDVSINGGNDGAIDLMVSGGTAPYTYIWNNGATTEDLSALTAAVFEVTVTDANGCSVSANISVLEPPVAVVQVESFIQLQVYPNPSKDRTIVDLTLANTSDVEIRLITITGQVLSKTNYAQISQLQHIIDVSMLPEATYLVQVLTENKFMTYRLVVAK